jgi:heterodisulfide reductase subunit B
VRSEVETVLGESLETLPPIIHPLELLATDVFEARIKAALIPDRDLSSLKVVCYYGCHISRPAKVMQFDDPENPQSMDRLMRWAGVQVLDWAAKVDCCGAHYCLVKPGIVVDLSARLFELALDVKEAPMQAYILINTSIGDTYVRSCSFTDHLFFAGQLRL